MCLYLHKGRRKGEKSFELHLLQLYRTFIGVCVQTHTHAYKVFVRSYRRHFLFFRRAPLTAGHEVDDTAWHRREHLFVCIMSCLLFLNFLLLIFAIALLILGITTPRWLVVVDESIAGARSERSIGIIASCQRLYRQAADDQFSTVTNVSSASNALDEEDASVCFNRLLKWNNATSAGPALLGMPMKLVERVIIDRQATVCPTHESA